MVGMDEIRGPAFRVVEGPMEREHDNLWYLGPQPCNDVVLDSYRQDLCDLCRHISGPAYYEKTWLKTTRLDSRQEENEWIIYVFQNTHGGLSTAIDHLSARRRWT